MTGSCVIRSAAAGWTGVQPARYKEEGESPGCFLGATRHALLGAAAEGPGAALDFELRYFELAPDGYSSLERHEHPHAVVVLRGRGTVRLGETVEEVGPFDVVYVAPHDVHRFAADSAEAFGFLCIVDRDRDRPVVVEEDDSGSTAR